ncbi:MAG TPA: hypothetical protein VFW11_24835 [Cyclobacteriaceae bacterium]|nr:hypothetical protein [Cyclobacteriaceae bacterium]
MLKKTLVIVGIAIVMCIVALYFVYNRPHRSVSVADTSMTAQSLVAAFDQNEIDANDRFLDKIIEVKGKVKEVIKQDDSFILLLGDEQLPGSVSCTLDQAQDSVAYGLKAGDSVVVRGICTGFLMDVILINCKVVNESTQM